jgi:uncharacterized damage-inducible protein DinB
MPPPDKTEENLRYPIGDFDKLTIGETQRRGHIEVIRLLPRALADSVHGLTESQLDTPYREGGWTLRQLIHHIADSHANAYIRIKLALTEDWPIIKPYEEAEWAKLVDSQLEVAVSLDLLTALHIRLTSLLKSLPDEAFKRGYTHPASGRQTLEHVIALYSWHSRHHTAHITSLRTRMGW